MTTPPSTPTLTRNCNQADICLHCALPDCDENDIHCPFHPKPKIRKQKESTHGHANYTRTG